MFRTMLIQERDGAISLLEGTSRRWLDQGQAVRIREAPTWYGPLSLECVSNVREGNVQVCVQVPPRLGEVPMRLCLRLPDGLRIVSVTLGGRPHAGVKGEWMDLGGVQGRVELTVQTEVKKKGALRPRGASQEARERFLTLCGPRKRFRQPRRPLVQPALAVDNCRGGSTLMGYAYARRRTNILTGTARHGGFLS
jgi:hypothetical protein